MTGMRASISLDISADLSNWQLLASYTQEQSHSMFRSHSYWCVFGSKNTASGIMGYEVQYSRR